jgi:two-component system, OmpR family, sensor histidine kinase VicK
MKVFLKAGIQNIPPMNFGVSDKEIAGTIEKMEGGKMSQSFLFSNEPLYINHCSSLFEKIWKDGIDAKERIALIEEGADLDIEVIPRAVRARELYLDALKKAQKDIIIFFPTTNTFLRQHEMEVVQLVVVNLFHPIRAYK